MKFYKMLLALLLATAAMCLGTENTFAAELTMEIADPGVLTTTADINESNQENLDPPYSEELEKLAMEAEENAAYPKDDVMLLAKLISHEAKGQCAEGMAAVAEVVLNRINTPLYPNTVNDVIFQRGQFSHARGIKKEKPSAEMIIIADLVLNYNYKVLNDSTVVNFKNPKKTNGISVNIRKNWGELIYFKCIGDHVFYADKNVAGI